MALGQQYAVTGRKAPNNYTDIINAQTPYLPALYRQKADEEYRDKDLALREEELATWEELQREEMAQAKRQAKYGNLIGLGNLGLKAGLGIYGDKIKDIVGGGTKSSIANPVVDAVSSSPAVSPTSWTGKVTDWDQWGDAVSSVSPWLGGAAGYLTSKMLTDKDDSKTKKALIGAGTGAAISAITSGADAYKAVVSGLLGGLGGLFG